MVRVCVLHRSTLLRSVVLLAALVLLLGSTVPASETHRLTSTWKVRDIRVDGADDDWRGATEPVGGMHFALGFTNDADDLYLCLLSKDQKTVRQVVRMGLIVWVSPAGGKERTFGVHFPLAFRLRIAERRAAPPDEKGQVNTPGVGVEPAPAGQDEVEILGPGRKDVRQSANGASGIQARCSVRDDLLIYEMKVPLRKGEGLPFALDVDPGAALRVELQTPEWRGPVPGVVGAHAWVGMEPRPGMGAYYPPMDTSVLKPLEMKADLRLASGPSR